MQAAPQQYRKGHENLNRMMIPIEQSALQDISNGVATHEMLHSARTKNEMPRDEAKIDTDAL